MVRQKIKRLTLLLGVALLVAAPLIVAAPVFGGRAVAVTNPGGGGAGAVIGVQGAALEDAAYSYIMYRAITFCLQQNASGSNSEFVANGSWNWFNGVSTHVALGYLDTDDSNGYTDCQDINPNDIQTAFSIWGIDDANTAMNDLGFTSNSDGTFSRPGTYYLFSKLTVSDQALAIAGLQNSVGLPFYGITSGLPQLDTNGQQDQAVLYYFAAQSVNDLCIQNSTAAAPYLTAYLTSDSQPTLHTSTHSAGDKVLVAETKTGYLEWSCGDGKAANTNSGTGSPNNLTLAAITIDYQSAYAAQEAVQGGNDQSPLSTADSTTGDGETQIKCGGLWNGLSSFGLSWLLCPIMQGAADLGNTLENSIDGMLCINTQQIFSGDAGVCSGNLGVDSGTTSNSTSGFEDAWQGFRDIAIGLIALAGLIMIVAQGLGLEIFDAYTVKKTLPRIIIAAIGISLSWWIMKFFVDLSNGLGIGVRGLIYAPFDKAGINTVSINGTTSLFTGLAGAGGLLLLGPLGGLSFLLTGVMAVMVAFFTLVIRNALVMLLIILAPIGIAAYVLPNTEKYWKIWWDWFFRALMAFPILTAIIAMGHVFAAVVSQNSSSTLNSITAFIAYFAPYFMIPMAFRMAGGALGTLSGMANDRSRGMFDRLSKFRQNEMQKRGAYYGQKYGDRAMQARAEAVRALNRKASTKGAFGSWALRGIGRQIGGLGDIEERMSGIQARASKRANDQIATGKDDAYRGLTVDRKSVDAAESTASMRERWTSGSELMSADGMKKIAKDGRVQYKSLGGGWVDQGDVDNAHREYGHDVGAQQAALSYEMRKAMESGDIDGMHERFNGVADAWHMTKTQRQGAWIGSGFENQNQHLGLKYTKFKDDGSMYVDYDGLSKEAYEKKGSYQLSQMSGQTIRDMRAGVAESKAAIAAGATGDDLVKHQARLDRFKAVSETFMHDMSPAAAAGVAAAGAAGTPPPAAGSPTSGRRFNANGAAAVNEEAYQLAVETGVIAAPPSNTDLGPTGPVVPGRSQGN